DTDASGWAPQNSLVTLSAINDGSPAPKALEVSFASGPVRAVAGAHQCIPVQPDRTYELSAEYLIPNDAPFGTGASVTTVLHAGSSCSGTPAAPPGAGPVGTVRGVWTAYAYSIDTSALPSGAEGRLFLRL